MFNKHIKDSWRNWEEGTGEAYTSRTEHGEGIPGEEKDPVSQMVTRSCDDKILLHPQP
jgi:hypothetical protein